MNAVTQDDVERFQALIDQRLGLSCADWQAERLPSLLRERIRAFRCDDAATYLLRLEERPDLLEKELGVLAEQLTVGETYFFREPRQIDALLHLALPELTRRRTSIGPLRILSAGCSSGEEAYTLAFALQQHFGESAPRAASVVGIDMNPVVIKKARQAIYSEWSLRATPGYIREQWFTPTGQSFRLKEPVRSMVSFEERNLLTDDPGFWRPGAFDIVFCRNVTIYFSPEATRIIVARIERSLVPGGFLFLGHSETLRGISDEFELMNTHETFYYRRKGTDVRTPREAPGPGRRPSSSSMPMLVPMESWVDAIQRSTERIEAFTRRTPIASEPLPTPANDAPKAAHLILERALALFRAERFTEALSLLQTVRADATRAGVPINPDVELLSAVIFSNQGCFVEAEGICARAIQAGEAGVADDSGIVAKAAIINDVSGLRAAAHYLLGLCREQAGDRLKAMEHHKSAIELDPSFSMPHLHLALLARRAGDMRAARAEMKLAAELVARERDDRILLFGGGFKRSALLDLCRAELVAGGGST